MNIKIYHWGGNLNNCPYKHLEEISSENFHKVAKEIFDKGLNVMMYHSMDDKSILFIDDKRFQQR